MVSDIIDVSRETAEKLDIYETLLRKWSQRINLVSAETLGSTRDRHFLDSAQLLDFVGPEIQTWCDLGSGGGFPGLVIAILASSTMPDLKVTLIESDQRKAAFLRTVSRETATPVTVITGRIEAAAPQCADIVSARAVAPLPKLLPLVARHLAPNGTALLLKGQSYEKELESARVKHRFALEIHSSRTDGEGVILAVGQIENA